MALSPDAWFVPAAPLAADDVPRRPERPSLERAEAVLGRDQATLAALYTEHAPAVLRFLRGLLRDRTAADDATQETFARAFRRFDTLREGDRIAPWLFGIARNVSLELRRARRRSGRVIAPTPSGDLEVDDRSADGRTPEAELLDREAVEIVGAALDRLSEDRRAVLLLRLDHGLAYEEIAGLMGWSLPKVKVELHRARQVLRGELSKYQGGSP